MYTTMPIGADLNNYHNSGLFMITNQASRYNNCPTGYSALIIIGENSVAHQFLFNNDYIYHRSYTGNPLAWTAWKSVYDI